jgi:hypothetical protein
MGLPIFPVGVCEKDDCLCIHFGSPYSLDLPSLSANGELDLAIRQLVMEHIRQVLP